MLPLPPPPSRPETFLQPCWPREPRGQLQGGTTPEVETEDLLGDATVHDVDTWNGDQPPGRRIQADVHTERRQEQHINVTTRRDRKFINDDGITEEAARAADEDKISVAGSVSDVSPPPNAGQHPQLNPFTLEWFAQVIGAAASAAATAAVKAATSTSKLSSDTSPASTPFSAPRRLNERKIPDFWEDKPDFWFRIFDAHLAHFNPSERQCFDTLLPLLTSAARATVHSVVKSPGTSP